MIVIVIVTRLLRVETNLAIIFHKGVQMCLYLNNPVSPIICAVRIRFLVFDCLSNWRNYIAFLTTARINLLLPWLEVKGLEHKLIFLWYIEGIVSKQHHLTPVNHLVVEVQFWAMFNCLIYFLDLFFLSSDKENLPVPYQHTTSSYFLNWFP